AADGGYYLIGLRRAAPPLFAGVQWGTGRVLSQTLARARKGGLSVKLLPRLPDVDRPEDLPVWERADARRRRQDGALISIIIPALNEEHAVVSVLASAARDSRAEVILVDGGSDDATAELARGAGAKVLRAVPPRANQMNVGAAHAQGRLLLFLHADTRLPWGYGQFVRDSLADGRVAAGAFELAINGEGAGLRLIEGLINLRARRLHLPYGDQAIFVRAETFRAVGGFPLMPLMEDCELMRRLCRRGHVALCPLPVLTAGRRWARMGVLKATLLNQLIIGAYRLGVAPARLARWYGRAAG
ncbi:MAG: TIGR04283 family arsenosugar biosynthesis glycosyltransferase, partial [Planctomycetota bacterium]